MNSKILHILREADDPEHWECPPWFPWEFEMSRIEELQPLFEKVIGHPLRLDRNIQDAAHFAELSWQTEPHFDKFFGARVVLTYVGIRFSTFGSLVTIWGNVPETPITFTLENQLGTILQQHGYQVIPIEDLNKPYDGVNMFASQIPTWWLRFFDYC